MAKLATKSSSDTHCHTHNEYKLALVTRGHILRAYELPSHEIHHIGRARACKVRIMDPQASAQHAAIANGVLIDLGSTNGIFVNGERITHFHVLTMGDIIQIGATVFRMMPSDKPSTASADNDDDVDANASDSDSSIVAIQETDAKSNYDTMTERNLATKSNKSAAHAQELDPLADALELMSSSPRAELHVPQSDRRIHISRTPSPQKPVAHPEQLFSPISANTLHHRSHADSAAVCALSDITNEPTDKQHNTAEHSMQQQTDLLCNVTAQLRSILSGVVGLSGLLEQTRLGTSQHGYVKDIQHASQSMLSIIEDFVDLSLLDAGSMHVEKKPVDIRSMCSYIHNLLQPSMRAKRLNFDVQIDDNVPHILLGDEQRIKQIVLHLLDNAQKFTPSGGQVHIEVKWSMPENAAVDPAKVYISVTDTGLGIADELHESVFEPMGEARRATGAKYGGSGIGMALCSKLAAAMTGSLLLLHSEPAQGSTFVLELPFCLTEAEDLHCRSPSPVDDDTQLRMKQLRANNEKARARVCEWQVAAMRQASTIRTSPPSRTRKGIRPLILVAEDQLVNQQVLCSMVRKLGGRVVLAENGREAVERFSQLFGQIACILCDISMPILNGHETTRIMRGLESKMCPQMEQAARVPIIALTENALPGAFRECLRFGMTDVLVKPFSLAQLGDILQRYAGIAPPMSISSSEQSEKESGSSKENSIGDSHRSLTTSSASLSSSTSSPSISAYRVSQSTVSPTTKAHMQSRQYSHMLGRASHEVDCPSSPSFSDNSPSPPRHTLHEIECPSSPSFSHSSSRSSSNSKSRSWKSKSRSRVQSQSRSQSRSGSHSRSRSRSSSAKRSSGSHTQSHPALPSQWNVPDPDPVSHELECNSPGPAEYFRTSVTPSTGSYQVRVVPPSPIEPVRDACHSPLPEYSISGKHASQHIHDDSGFDSGDNDPWQADMSHDALDVFERAQARHRAQLSFVPGTPDVSNVWLE
jgi:signal transduction histidine kinase/CheY-like chemotaxis protein